MLKEIRVKNFRGISDGNIKGLSRVNVFVGKNNAGKSTLLECLYFIKASLKPKDELNRATLNQLLQRRIRRPVRDVKEFWYKYRSEEKIGIELVFIDDSKVLVEITSDGQRMNYNFLHPDTRKSIFKMNLTPSESTVRYSGGRSSGTTDRAVVDYIVEGSKGAAPEGDYIIRMEKKLRFIENLVLVDDEIVRDLDRIEKAFWGDMIINRLDKPLRDTINTAYETGIDHFTFAPYLREHSKLYAALPDISEHIDDFGDGFRYGLAVLTLAQQLRDTALLFEEPEGHQHSRALELLLKALLEITYKSNLQLFITTHSIEVLDVLAELSKEKGYDLGIFHVERDNEGHLHLRPIEGPDIPLLLSLGVDLRKLGMAKLVVVEGDEDEAFIELLLRKLYGNSSEKMGIKIVKAGNKDSAINSVLPVVVKLRDPIILMVDYDDEDLEKIISRVENQLKRRCPERDVVVDDDTVKVEGLATINVGAFGLPDDEDLKRVGVLKHATEDYILKLLLIDENSCQALGKTRKDVEDIINNLKKKPLQPHISLDRKKSSILLEWVFIQSNLKKSEAVSKIIEATSPIALYNIVKEILERLGLPSINKLKLESTWPRSAP